MCLCGVCIPVVILGLCEVVVVPYIVGAVLAVTMMHVLLFVLHVCMLRECEGARVTAMPVLGPGEKCGLGQGLGGWVVIMSVCVVSLYYLC